MIIHDMLTLLALPPKSAVYLINDSGETYEFPRHAQCLDEVIRMTTAGHFFRDFLVRNGAKVVDGKDEVCCRCGRKFT